MQRVARLADSYTQQPFVEFMSHDLNSCSRFTHYGPAFIVAYYSAWVYFVTFVTSMPVW